MPLLLPTYTSHALIMHVSGAIHTQILYLKDTGRVLYAKTLERYYAAANAYHPSLRLFDSSIAAPPTLNRQLGMSILLVLPKYQF